MCPVVLGGRGSSVVFHLKWVSLSWGVAVIVIKPKESFFCNNTTACTTPLMLHICSLSSRSFLEFVLCGVTTNLIEQNMRAKAARSFGFCTLECVCQSRNTSRKRTFAQIPTDKSDFWSWWVWGKGHPCNSSYNFLQRVQICSNDGLHFVKVGQEVWRWRRFDLYIDLLFTSICNDIL